MRHAYLVMAHNQFELLGRLLRALDHKDHHIFLHIDAKARDVDMKAIAACCTQAPITFIPRMRVFWGGYTQVRCELNLLEAARKEGPFDYYHLMSGVDFLIKPLPMIHRFFEEHKGKEFIEIAPGWAESPAIRVRYTYYQLFQDMPIKRTQHPVGRWLHDRLNALSLRIQMSLLRVDRTKKKGAPQHFYGGMNWFSITDDLCAWVLSKKRWIHRTFRLTSNSDEIYLQTVFMQSPYADNLYQHDTGASDCGSKRLVDWNRGKPYVWRKQDYEELIASQNLFARKFDYTTEEDRQLIDMLWAYISA